ncbi:hypothetical protein B0H11DRAFT_2250902 [Mycena galericulata]|nr:hypothetical protein B0H11DRAFT_2250902 [Mycena galericulata]
MSAMAPSWTLSVRRFSRILRGQTQYGPLHSGMTGDLAWLTISDKTFRLEHLGAVLQMTPRLCLLTFPRLLSYRIEEVMDEYFGEVPGVNLVAEFLTRHSTLTHVHVNWSPRLAVRIPLPNLCLFEGTSTFVPGLAASNLRVSRLEWIGSPPWTQGELTIDETIVALNSLTTSSSPFISAHDCSLDLAAIKELLRCLSTHMPHTTSLQIRTSPSDENIDRVTEYLPRFNRLAFLSLDCLSTRPPTAVDRTRAAVQTWAAACPTLAACNLYGSAWTKVDGIWQEYAVEKFLVQAGVSELGRMMY